MIILKDPEAARSMGLISTKAQLAAGVADWPAFFGMLAQAIAIGGAIVFAILTAWVFGREFSDRTAKELLALPTSRAGHRRCKIRPDRGLDDRGQPVHFRVGPDRGQHGCHPGLVTGTPPKRVCQLHWCCHLDHCFDPVCGPAGQYWKRLYARLRLGYPTIVLPDRGSHRLGRLVPLVRAGTLQRCGGSAAELLGSYSYVIVIVASLIGPAATLYWWRSADQTK